MDQYCPRCHEQKVFRSNTGSYGRYGGLAGMLIANSISSYQCPTCGKIPITEFPEEFQAGVKRKRVFSILGAIGIVVLVAVLFGLRSSF